MARAGALATNGSTQIGYLAWAWNADFDCSSGPGLITGYGPGDPTSYGAAYKATLPRWASEPVAGAYRERRDANLGG